MAEFLSFLNKREDVKNPEEIKLELYGCPKPEVVEAAKKAVKLTMQEMQYNGHPPPLRIAEGVVNDKYAGVIAGVFEWATESVVIGQGTLQSLLRAGVSAPDEALAALVASEETAHYIQYKLGRGSRELFLDVDAAAHYEHPTEKEAGAVSIRVANKLFPHIGFSRTRQGIEE